MLRQGQTDTSRAAQDVLSAYRPYPKQLAFHEAGAAHRERLLMAGNQVGKTFCGAAEAAIHLTGLYPDWWTGQRFDRAVRMWAGSKTAEVARDTVQRLLIGEPRDAGEWGTGLIPKARLLDCARKPGTANALDGVTVAHASGGKSSLGFKSYDQGREKWQGETLDLVWFDEEPPYDIYMEGLTRTNASGGMAFMTFTPLLGMSDVVELFLESPSHTRSGEYSYDNGRGLYLPKARCVVQMTIDDALHYTDEQRADVIASYSEHEREARVKGVPTLGSGRVFPVLEERIICPPFDPPREWPRIIGLDFGFGHPFAAVGNAWDRNHDCMYVIQEYAESLTTPMIHAANIKPWGDWIPCAWPHDGLQHDKGSGLQLAQQYRDQGLNMLSERAQWPEGGFGVEAGIMMMLDRMKTGRLKVFSSCTGWLNEFRGYHRENGLLVKRRDDRISATRYAMMMLRYADTKPEPQLRTEDIVLQKFGW